MITPTFSEHVTLGDVPLSCPAWEATDLSSLWETASYRGGDIVVPYAPGVRAGRRVVESRRVVIPVTVFGTHDPEGTPYADARAGLRANIDRLALLMRPTDTSLVLHLPDGSTRRATALPMGAIQLDPIGPAATKVVLDLLLPEGLWRSSTATTTTSSSVSAGATGTLTVPNAGTAEQWSSTLTLSGTATAVTIVNTSFAGPPTLTVTTNLASGNVVINTETYTALRGSTSVAGSLTPSGHPCWLPLAPGNNAVTIAPTGGTCTLSIVHYAPYL